MGSAVVQISRLEIWKKEFTVETNTDWNGNWTDFTAKIQLAKQLNEIETKQSQKIPKKWQKKIFLQQTIKHVEYRSQVQNANKI